VANVSGEFYSQDPDSVPQMIECLARQVASPVQFVKGLETLYEAGARVFVEVGPKKALAGFAEDVLGDRAGVLTLFSNHPKLGGVRAFNQALAGLYAAGHGAPQDHRASAAPVGAKQESQGGREGAGATAPLGVTRDGNGAGADTVAVVSGAALGLPGEGRVFDDSNVERILSGEQEIDVIPTRFRQAMVNKHITRLVKEGSGEPHFQTIGSTSEVIKLAGRKGEFDLTAEFGVPEDRVGAYDTTTALAIAAGIDALRDAGIPLVMHYRRTTKGTFIPVRYMLPESLRDDTGIVFASCFPGIDAFADELTRYQQERDRELELKMLQRLRERFAGIDSPLLRDELEREIHALKGLLDEEPYEFNRRFIFRTLAMGHSSSPSTSGPAGPTPRSIPPAPAAPRPSPSPRTGSAPAAAAGC
jgi:hypothetical protein